MVRYHNITKCDMLNGYGLRVVLWLSHCDHRCKGCHNMITWDKDSGIVFDEDAKNEIFEELDKDYTKGITFSGGDPLSHINRDFTISFIKEIKDRYKDKDIWVYSGYTWEEISNIDGIENIDILVDGKYEEKLTIPKPLWRGSNNQRIIDVKETLRLNKVVTL